MDLPQPLAPPEAGARPSRALVLSGGVALGAFEAGACAALEETGEPDPGWVVGASAGALNAAIIAGNPPGRRAAQLRRFWDSLAIEPTPVTSFLLGSPPSAGPWRRAYNQASAMEVLLFGCPGLFRPRLVPGARIGEAPSLYDLEPLRARLREIVDFERLNGGGMRLGVTATDVVSGERVVFDTARGDRIGPEHLIASCALLPLFAPVEIEGRLLGDGGLASANTPLDLVLDEPGTGDLLCFVIELFARGGSRPRTLGASVARATDLAFGNQTRRLLEGRAREQRLRDVIARLGARLPDADRADPEIGSLLAEAGEETGTRTLVCLGYHAAEDEAGPGKVFDFSRATLADRWAAGARGMQRALRQLRQPEAAMTAAMTLAPGLLLHEVKVEA